jgi:hypothetical protein
MPQRLDHRAGSSIFLGDALRRAVSSSGIVKSGQINASAARRLRERHG